MLRFGKVIDEVQAEQARRVYAHDSLAVVLKCLEQSGQTLWGYVLDTEPDLEPFLGEVWDSMCLEILKTGLRGGGARYTFCFIG